MYVTQCFDVASENAMTEMGCTTGIIRVNLECLCSDTATIVSCKAQDPNEKGVLRTSVQTSHRRVPCNLGTVHSSWRRQRGQDHEQDCEVGQASVRSRT